MKDITKIHIEKKTLHSFVIDPDHYERKESSTFRKAKDRLKEDGHYTCYICGATEELQVHHRAGEYMFENIIDYDLLKAFCEEWDVYGYGRLLKNQPITTVDDIRNSMVLCQDHHTGTSDGNGTGNSIGTGIHQMDFPSWIIQKLAIKGANPVPQDGETTEEAMARVKAHERKLTDQ